MLNYIQNYSEEIMGSMKSLKVSNTTIKTIALLYCALPVGCFTLLYMSTWIGIAAFALLGVSVFLAIRSNRRGDREYILISRKAIVFLYASRLYGLFWVV